MPEASPVNVSFTSDVSDLVDGAKQASSAMRDFSASSDSLSKSLRQSTTESRGVFRALIEARVALMSVENLTKDLGIQNQFLNDTYKALNVTMDVAISLAAIMRAADLAKAGAKWISAKAALAESAAQAGTISFGAGIAIVAAAGLAAFAAVEGFHAAGAFARGGVVSQPTLALIGEAGPEAVVPLNRAGGFGGVTIQQMIIQSNDPDMISRELGRRLQQLQGAGAF